MKNQNLLLIIDNEDIIKYLSQEQYDELSTICKAMETGRKNDGKKPEEYIVVNKNESYSSEIIEFINNVVELHGVHKQNKI